MKKVFYLLFFAFMIAIGLNVGYIFGTKVLGDPLGIWLPLVFSIVAFVLSVIIHELGHLIFGLLTGFEFVSFRIFSFLIYKSNDGKLKIRQVKDAFLGQCLMKYKKEYNDKLPFFWYNFGGGLLNLLIGGACFISLFYANNVVLVIFLLCLLFVSALLVACNLFPYCAQTNDMLNIILIYKSNESKKAFYEQLEFVCELQSNTDVMNRQILDYDFNEVNNITVSMYQFAMQQAFHRGDFTLGNQLLDLLKNNLSLLPQILHFDVISSIVMMDGLFNKKDTSNELFSKIKPKLIKAIKNIKDANFRLDYIAYCVFYSKDYGEALSLFEEARKLVSSYHFIGYRPFMTQMLDMLEDVAKNA